MTNQWGKTRFTVIDILILGHGVLGESRSKWVVSQGQLGEGRTRYPLGKEKFGRAGLGLAQGRCVEKKGMQKSLH